MPTPDPSTGVGFDAVEVGFDDYFDRNATDPTIPGALGLQIRVHHWWQGDVSFDTFETLGPVMGEGPDATTIVSGPGGTTPLGLEAGFGPNGEPPGSGTDPTGAFVVQTPPFVPLLGITEHIIVIELHNAYGFPGGVCKFPVTPEGPGPDFPSNTHWYPNLVGFGEIVVPGYEKLETIGWQSFWPNAAGYDDYCSISLDDLTNQGDPHDQSGPIANLIWTKRFSTVCRLVVGSSLFNDDVIITDFGYSDEFGDPNSVKYKITFKRYRSTKITSVSNPDADIDHFAQIPSNNSPTSIIVAPTNPIGDGTTPIVIKDPDFPPVTTPETVFPDEGAARAAQTAGIVQNPIVVFNVKSLADPDAWNGNAIAHIFEQDKGETLDNIAHRAGVTWDGVQIDLNPQYKFTDPYTVNLSVGAPVRFALGRPSLESATPTAVGPTTVAPSVIFDPRLNPDSQPSPLITTER